LNDGLKLKNIENRKKPKDSIQLFNLKRKKKLVSFEADYKELKETLTPNESRKEKQKKKKKKKKKTKLEVNF